MIKDEVIDQLIKVRTCINLVNIGRVGCPLFLNTNRTVLALETEATLEAMLGLYKRMLEELQNIKSN